MTSVILSGLTEARICLETDTDMDVKKKGNNDIDIIHIISLWPYISRSLRINKQLSNYVVLGIIRN